MNSDRSSIATRSAAITISVVMLLGCGDGKPRAYSTRGQVTIDGQPAEGVELIFYADDPPPTELGVPVPRAFSDSNGQFSASTYFGGDGAPAGNYKLSAVLMTKLAGDADPESVEAVDRLRGRYSDPNVSGLEIEVPKGGVDSLSLNLQSGAQ